MLAVISPVILFHMLATFIRFHFAKVRDTKKQLANTKDQPFAVSTQYSALQIVLYVQVICSCKQKTKIEPGESK